MWRGDAIHWAYRMGRYSDAKHAIDCKFSDIRPSAN
jgi:hypothetical protein